MVIEIVSILKSKLSEKDYQKLMELDNKEIIEFIAKFVDLCDPSKVTICNDSEEDIRYTREAAIKNNEEAKLSILGHTIHYDGYYDQARDKARTKFLLPKGKDLGPELNTMDKEEGLKEIYKIMKDIMNDHELFVKFFTLGPNNSKFSIPCVQLTDSAYVAHSEDLLYRQGYQDFVRLGKNAKFFKFIHSQGELEEESLGLLVSKNIDERRIYIDLEDEIIYCTNTQYGGNTIGLKKLAMRLAINRASKEGWLTEHMLIMGVRGPKKRISYFTGAFPSMCGKTSTAMINGENIVGDDIAYIRNIYGKARSVNVESGIFGIIEGINDKDDPLQWKALHEPIEIIFTNLLYYDNGKVYWNGKPGEKPKKGFNHSGEWYEGKKDKEGNVITASHRNARFTFKMDVLCNTDKKLHDPIGVEVSGFIYGGRDSDTSVPVEESFDWVHGIIIKGACLESETTAATLGKEGVRVFNSMSNIDFLSIPISKYIENNLRFGRKFKNPPSIFSVNYFLRDKDGNWLNHKNDKAIWLKWIELRVNNDVDAIKTPTGYIPLYEDLKRLFKQVLNKTYTKEDYIKQFTVRIPENLSKIERMNKIFTTRVQDTPEILFKVLQEQKERLLVVQKKYGDYISPYDLF
ncbi:MAG: phosphoenolpyruvate carboxykinase (GTP) [Candidatus Thermoplasmatota archaeon]|nr:phosphoenolpyruvate carboxykinase (GTP) [Candidatus Thermoplasmatota archaeon]